MWAYQPHFRSSMEQRAQEVLGELGARLHPRAFLVGIRLPDVGSGHPVCLEPEDDPEYPPSFFTGCATRVDQIYSDHPDHQTRYGDEARNRDQPELIRRRSVLAAVREVTNLQDEKRGTKTFCGAPTRVNDYYVVPALEFRGPEVRALPQLPERIKFRDWTSDLGVTDALVVRLLAEASEALARKDPGRYADTFERDTLGLLRDGGRALCNAIGPALENFMLQGVFEALNEISAARYEGGAAHGQIVFCPSEHSSVRRTVALKERVPFRSVRLARKIVEMSGRDLVCLCHGSEGLAGLGMLTDRDARLFRVEFTDHYRWSLSYGERLLMKTSFGVPALPSVPLDEPSFVGNAIRVLPTLSSEKATSLWKSVHAAMEQRHGAMLVVTDVAQAEARRLATQALPVEPGPLTPDMVLQVSGIDGAILVNTDGVCFALGVILDGLATQDGDPARGARYNSAVRYVGLRHAPTLCVVISEDGHVNMIPTLRPQVRRAEILAHVELLKSSNRDNYHKAQLWLDRHRFYLNVEECDAINHELVRLGAEPSDVGELRYIVGTFEPNPEMNSSYYTD